MLSGIAALLVMIFALVSHFLLNDPIPAFAVPAALAIGCMFVLFSSSDSKKKKAQ